MPGYFTTIDLQEMVVQPRVLHQRPRPESSNSYDRPRPENSSSYKRSRPENSNNYQRSRPKSSSLNGDKSTWSREHQDWRKQEVRSSQSACSSNQVRYKFQSSSDSALGSRESSCEISAPISTERSQRPVEKEEQPLVYAEKSSGSQPASPLRTVDDHYKEAALPVTQPFDCSNHMDVPRAMQVDMDGDSVVADKVVGDDDPAKEDEPNEISASPGESCPGAAVSQDGENAPLAKEIPMITPASVKPVSDVCPRRKLTLQDYRLRQQQRRVAACKAMPYHLKAVQKMVTKLEEQIAGRTVAIDTLSVNMEVLTSAVNEMCTLQKKLLEQYEKQNQLLQEKIEIQKAMQENGVEQVNIMTSLTSFFKIFLQTQEARINSEWKGLQEAKSQL